MTAVFDVAAFEQFTDEVRSRSVALDFLRSFTAMLDDRIRVIEQTLKAGTSHETLRALHSLRASAAMVGARQLEAAATSALTNSNCETQPISPFIRKLQGQAELFRTATITFSTAETTPEHHSEAWERAGKSTSVSHRKI